MRSLEIFLLAASAFFGVLMLLLLIVPKRNSGNTNKITPKYRADYYYSEEADAFYKIHLGKNYFSMAISSCQRDSAELISSDKHDLMIAQKLYEDKVGKTGDIISFVAEQGVVIGDFQCRALDTSGHLIQKHCYLDADSVVCKIEANKVQYDERCKMFFTSNETKYTPNNALGSCYYMPHFSLTWQQAEDRCELDGGHLVVINSKQEAEFLTEFVKDKNHYRVASYNTDYLAIGFSFSHTEDGKRVFTSVFGRSLAEEGYDTWAPTEPNNKGDRENCGSWFVNQPGLNDAFCGLVWGFVCEKEMHCECCTPKCLRKQ